MFASKIAALHDEHADAAIGNVTGSNAVDIFLGLGLAWSIASIYQAVKGNRFCVRPGSLAFSVTVFVVGAVIAVAGLLIRRKETVAGGELGGPSSLKHIFTVMLILIWITYLVLSGLEIYGVLSGF